MRHLLKSAAAKGFLLTSLLLFAASICRAQSAAPETPDYTLRSGGMERTYKLEGRMTEAEHDIRDLKGRER